MLRESRGGDPNNALRFKHVSEIFWGEGIRRWMFILTNSRRLGGEEEIGVFQG
jgi:hypothetical protein